MSCGLTQEKLDAKGWAGDDQRCKAIAPCGKVCGDFYSQHVVEGDAVIVGLTTAVAAFLNNPALGKVSYALLLMQFMEEIAPAVSCEIKEAETAVKDMLADFKLQIVRGDLENQQNYMEADVDSQTVHVNLEWLKRASEVEGFERQCHDHLLLQKALHEVAHLLTDKFVSWCERKAQSERIPRESRKRKRAKKITPTKIDIKGKGKMKIGDAGYGWEEIASSGRMFHLAHPESPWKISGLILQKLNRTSWISYHVPEKFASSSKRKLKAFVPAVRRKVNWNEEKAKQRKKGAGFSSIDSCLKTTEKGFIVYEPADIAVKHKA
eukprot:gb/GEZN01011945.1/.p1 GENE.gb/GEZN01011945.1/~~gb/GEZN01011945.1/.p1  ORF type:complete len:322 (+),score=50.18 gb/GEZN01011945.1/:70-1035(+)